MRLLLLSTLLSLSLSAAAARPPGYHPPRRYFTASNQPYYRPPVRVNAGVNLAYYNGDLTNRLSDNTLKMGLNLGLARELSPHLTFALDLSYLHLAAKDYYPSRGYRFTDDAGVLTALLRYNIIGDKQMLIGPSHKEMPLLVFVSGGGAALLYKPSLSRFDAALPPEPGNSYPAAALALPVGGGLTLRASPYLAFTAEALYYFTTTDLLDDVSQRGNPGQPDGFATVTLKAEFSFKKGAGKVLVHND
ncbi:hypothetical protein [Hymenobacter psoromatis]|uniref:hypothetical protein n=1 Tax=Hymenobacter psoromatis TaxID=1484116 RepID=UPI001CC0665B|nr:hypothetical protein [Hymenobacter psoromatis]